MRVLFIYPEHYLNIGIPGGISMLSANLKKHGRSSMADSAKRKRTPPAFHR